MFRILTACALLTAALAAEPVRDPFAAPAPTAPATGGPAAAPRSAVLPDLVLEGLARSGDQTIAILRIGTRRVLVAKDKEFACAGRILRLVSLGDGEVLLRGRDGDEHTLAVGIPPPDGRPVLPAGASPPAGGSE